MHIGIREHESQPVEHGSTLDFEIDVMNTIMHEVQTTENPVELVIEKLGDDEQGNEIMAHKFRPISK